MDFAARFDAELVADGGGDVDAGFGILGVARRAVAEDVLPVIGDPRATVFPLGVAGSVAGDDLDPAAFADALSGAG